MKRIIDAFQHHDTGRMTLSELQQRVRAKPALFEAVIAAMERAGTLVSEWDDSPDQPADCPRRRIYRLPDASD